MDGAPEPPALVLPAHVEDTVQAIAEVHLRHHEKATAVQRAVDRMTRFVARPRFLVAMTIVVIAWVALNLLLKASGGAAFDEPPFQWLQDASTIVALYITVLILITQRRENQLTEQREQLTLQLALLSEQKAAKIVALLEEMRRDNPAMVDRIDAEAEEMARRTDPQAVLDAIKERHGRHGMGDEDEV